MQSRYIIKSAVITEKTAWQIERRNVYTFVVPLDATKVDIKRAIESVYAVKVECVRTMRRQSVSCRFKGLRSSTSEIKRAIVKLRTGDRIETY